LRPTMLLTRKRGRLGHMQTTKLRHCAATRGLKIDGSRGVIYHNTSVCLTVAADLWLHSRHHEAVKLRQEAPSATLQFHKLGAGSLINHYAKRRGIRGK
jgi:hypothetical protein